MSQRKGMSLFKIRRRSKGVILTEFLMSVALLLLVLLGGSLIFKASHNLAEDSRQRIVALGAASSVLETVKDTPIAAVPSINTAAMLPAELQNAQIVITTNPANVSNATVATVTVTVSWVGPLGRQRSLQLSTMRTKF